MLLAAACQSPPCWAPGSPPAWTWLIYLAIAALAGALILADVITEPPDRRRFTAVAVWIMSVLLIAVSAEMLELYRYSITPK